MGYPMLHGLDELPTVTVAPEQARWVAANTGADLAEMLGYRRYLGHDHYKGRPRPSIRKPEFPLRK